jgi:hypothetical protein
VARANILREVRTDVPARPLVPRPEETCRQALKAHTDSFTSSRARARKSHRAFARPERVGDPSLHNQYRHRLPNSVILSGALKIRFANLTAQSKDTPGTSAKCRISPRPCEKSNNRLREDCVGTGL